MNDGGSAVCVCVCTNCVIHHHRDLKKEKKIRLESLGVNEWVTEWEESVRERETKKRDSRRWNFSYCYYKLLFVTMCGKWEYEMENHGKYYFFLTLLTICLFFFVGFQWTMTTMKAKATKIHTQKALTNAKVDNKRTQKKKRLIERKIERRKKCEDEEKWMARDHYAFNRFIFAVAQLQF